jgi:hypothetical protein
LANAAPEHFYAQYKLVDGHGQPDIVIEGRDIYSMERPVIVLVD